LVIYKKTVPEETALSQKKGDYFYLVLENLYLTYPNRCYVFLK